MKAVSLFISIIFCFQAAFSAPAVKKPVTLKLRDTVLTVNTFRKLNGADQVAYLRYVMSMLAVIEKSQNIKSIYYTPKKKSKTATFEFFSKAFAAEPLAGSFLTVGPGNPTADPFSKDIKTDWLTHAITDGSIKEVPSLTGNPSVGYELSAPPTFEAMAAKAAVPQSSAQLAHDNAIDYRKGGGFCIFGGYGSSYKQVGERYICPTPDEVYCNEENEPDKFACNTFGIENDEVQKAACITMVSPTNGLKDLTKRCVEAISDLLTKTPFPVKAEELDKLFTELQKAIDNFKGGGYEKYCGEKNDNVVNEGKQSVECTAIKKLIDQFNATLGKKAEIQAAAKAAQATPAAPPAAAAPAPPAKAKP